MAAIYFTFGRKKTFRKKSRLCKFNKIIWTHLAELARLTHVFGQTTVKI